MQLKSIIFAILVALLLSSCGITKKVNLVKPEVNMSLDFKPETVEKISENLSKTVRVQVNCNLDSSDFIDISRLPVQSRLFIPHYIFSPNLGEAMRSGVMTEMRDLGFSVSPYGDNVLVIEIKSFKGTFLSAKEMVWSMSFSYRLDNEAGQTLVAGSTVSANSCVNANEAFQNSMKQVMWNRIAASLEGTKTPLNPKNVMVYGNGDTALEHSVIRWFIISSPEGADVSWRVISSTSDVANTNSNYVGTAPYESTESLDIKGLTYNNSGNVQIEVTCELKGYLPQKKRFNLRQVIDQKEISSKFNLIKED